MSLADYVAKNYLNLDSSSGKGNKRRKKKTETSTNHGIYIADDDSIAISASVEDEKVELESQTMNTTYSEFRKSRKDNWKIVGLPTPSSVEQAAADAIIASTVDENAIRNATEENEPQILDDINHSKMESGAHAGLQSAAQVDAAVQNRKAAERRRFETEAAENTGKGQETIYRDASGRIINVAMKRAEARRKAQVAESKKKQELEESKGDVQRAEREAKKQALTEAKYMNVARYADDVDLNDELKERERWNDPAAKFLAKNKTSKSPSGKPLYQATAPPNRYGIRPGYRWDGVDRSNGFEKEYFAARNRKQNSKDLQYQWQYDV